MEKKIGDFYFHETQKCWQGMLKHKEKNCYIIISKKEIEIRKSNYYLRSYRKNIESTLSSIERDIDELERQSIILLKQLAKVFFDDCGEYYFELQGFIFDDITTILDINYRICFKCFNSQGEEDNVMWYTEKGEFRELIGCSREVNT